MQKSSIVLLITALCLAGAGSVSAAPSDCNGRTGKIRHERACDAYYDCTDGLGVLVTCPETHYFNSQTSTCEIAGEFDCIESGV
ncbi:hypothetical protein INT48_005002 [Thamnidium elegans]|uniref:Chitin-binding type-2 domain-containing protein n=1 Tax=Thamnidium elegans TaxID=101142 RepID=A0A8H7SVX4_9FUNG|nr:hypothetical protein INT48_005002 [Thamnidium elegans]